jgi:hypothetical protein
LEWGFVVAFGFAAYLLLLVISYLLLSHPDVDPSFGANFLVLSLVALIVPGYVIIRAIWIMLYSMPVMLFLMVLLLWPIFYLLTRNFMRPVSQEDEVLAFSFSLGAVLFFVLVMEAAVALAVLVLHLFVSKQIWSLASRAREKASGKPLPKLFK